MQKLKKPVSTSGPSALPKCPTGIRGLDEITFGGLPQGRPTLVCGGAGCGKTLLGMEFLVRGATQFNEPGVCVSFEETTEELAANAASLGFEIPRLIKEKKLAVDYVFIERSLVEETGEYDLEALFVRLGYAIDTVGAKRVLLDSVESLFSGLQNEAILRAELRRLFRWLKDRNVTAIVTGERGEGKLTRHGLEEYISDCVILLDHRVADNVFTRRLRVVKYRGSTHGTNEYPFLIERDGISVLPITSVELAHPGIEERISSGIPALDEMLGGKGFYRASSILLSGSAGTGKTSVSAHFADATCRRGERCVFFSFEESPEQVMRNMRSIGIDLKQWVGRGLLQFQAFRPTSFGLEMHLVKIHRIIDEFNPSTVVLDPISGLLHAGGREETRNMLLRLVDFLKQKNITAFMTTLTTAGQLLEQSEIEVSSLVDSWIMLQDLESGGERNRGLYLLKVRGVAHSNQVREFLLTDHGVRLQDVYLGQGSVLTGSARLAQEAREANQKLLESQESERRQFVLERRRKALAAQIEALKLQLESEEAKARQFKEQEQLRWDKTSQDRVHMARAGSWPISTRAVKKGGKGALENSRFRYETCYNRKRDPAGNGLESAIVRCRPNAEIRSGACEPETDLR